MNLRLTHRERSVSKEPKDTPNEHVKALLIWHREIDEWLGEGSRYD